MQKGCSNSLFQLSFLLYSIFSFYHFIRLYFPNIWSSFPIVWILSFQHWLKQQFLVQRHLDFVEIFGYSQCNFRLIGEPAGRFFGHWSVFSCMYFVITICRKVVQKQFWMCMFSMLNVFEWVQCFKCEFKLCLNVWMFICSFIFNSFTLSIPSIKSLKFIHFIHSFSGCHAT